MALQPSPDDQNDNVDIVKELPAAPTPSLISLNCSDGFLWCRPFEVRRYDGLFVLIFSRPMQSSSSKALNLSFQTAKAQTSDLDATGCAK